MLPETCPDCGAKLELSTGPGRYKNSQGYAVELPADFSFPRCSKCGASWLDSAQVDQMSALVDNARRSREVASAPRTLIFPNDFPGRTAYINAVTSLRHHAVEIVGGAWELNRLATVAPRPNPRVFVSALPQPVLPAIPIGCTIQ